MLAEIGTAIDPMKRSIRVEGHTDDQPIKTSRYPSNWELSTARAISVIDYFITRAGISSHRLSAIGYGSVKPRVPNDSDRHRRMNRRVEIILGQTVPKQVGTGSIEGE
jgi:chemotaxis protein MotB